MNNARMIDPKAYDNADFIPGGHAYWERWEKAAAAFRASQTRARLDIPYGPHPREAFDLFAPDSAPRGLLVFLHGGFWRGGDRKVWSHLAAGPLCRGWAVAMPSYPLCPEVSIGAITQSIARALPVMAGEVSGPLVIAGHSAGGHLALRMVCPDTRMGDDVAPRISAVCALSPLADLAPLIEMPMNADLAIDPACAASESPVNWPPSDVDVHLLVGAEERPAFLDQARWMSRAWPDATLSIVGNAHHFNIIEELEDGESALVALLTRAIS